MIVLLEFGREQTNKYSCKKRETRKWRNSLNRNSQKKKNVYFFSFIFFDHKREMEEKKFVLDKNEKELIESGRAQKNSLKTVKAADRLMEAIELCDEEQTKVEEYELAVENYKKRGPREEIEKKMAAGQTLLAPPIMSPLLVRKTPSTYLLDLLLQIPNCDREDALLLLPFGFVVKLLRFLAIWVQQNSEIELCCRSLFFLLRVHLNEISATKSLLLQITNLAHQTKQKLKNYKEMIGFNQAALLHVKRSLESSNTTLFHNEIRDKLVNMKKKRKLKEKASKTNL